MHKTLFLLLLAIPTKDIVLGQKTIYLHGATGTAQYEVAVDWIAAFEAKFPEVDLTVSSVGSGASHAALWGDIDCEKKPIVALCNNNGEGPGRTVWGMGGSVFDADEYIDHGELQLQQLPAMGGPVIPIYSKDVTDNLGAKDDARLNMTFDVLAGIFNGSITKWSHPSIVALNPQLTLPIEPINVFVREDQSGMTDVFTNAIYNAVPEWSENAVGKQPDWPISNMMKASSGITFRDPDIRDVHHFKADGQTGIGLGLLRRPYSIGYVELGYYRELSQFVSQVHISSSAHPNLFLPANPESISRTMDGLLDVIDPTTLAANLVVEDIPIGGYPISRYAFWYIKKSYTEYADCDQAWSLVTFIKWTYEDPLAAEISIKNGWIVPPKSVVLKALDKLNEVTCIDTNTNITISALSYIPRQYRPNLHQIDAIRPISWALAIIVVSGSVLCFSWVWGKRKTRVVRASQPEFLVMICCGMFIMGTAIIPLGIDDSNTSQEGCNSACVAAPWLFTCGFTIVFSALFSKIWRVNKIFNSGRFKRVKVETTDALIPFGILFASNFVFLLLWTLLDPPIWKRILMDSENSYGKCQSEGNTSTALLTLIAIVNVVALILANQQAYRARGISDEFSEGKYIGIAMASILQVVIIGLPLVFLLDTNPSARLFVYTGIIFVICISLQVLIFVPKIILYRYRKEVAMEGNLRISGMDPCPSFHSGVSHTPSTDLQIEDEEEYGYGGVGTMIMSHPKLQEHLQEANKKFKSEIQRLEGRIKELESLIDCDPELSPRANDSSSLEQEKYTGTARNSMSLKLQHTSTKHDGHIEELHNTEPVDCSE